MDTSSTQRADDDTCSIHTELPPYTKDTIPDREKSPAPSYRTGLPIDHSTGDESVKAEESSAKASERKELPELWESLYTTILNGEHEKALELLRSEVPLVAPNPEAHTGKTLLHAAAASNCVDIAAILLNRGLIINARSRDGTPLDFALRKHPGKNQNMVALFLKYAANVDASGCYISTALYKAAGCKSNAVTVQLLLDHGADVNFETPAERDATPLHNAVLSDDAEIMELLILAGSNVNAQDRFGKTPLDWAISKGYGEMCDILERHGGKYHLPGWRSERPQKESFWSLIKWLFFS